MFRLTDKGCSIDDWLFRQQGVNVYVWCLDANVPFHFALLIRYIIDMASWAPALLVCFRVYFFHARSLHFNAKRVRYFPKPPAGAATQSVNECWQKINITIRKDLKTLLRPSQRTRTIRPPEIKSGHMRHWFHLAELSNKPDRNNSRMWHTTY